MKLNSVELYGFKSFPHRTEIRFNEGITGIVGPNGSGKSNIADAVRWVLGEQSAKMLRGARMEDVIFGGTQTRKAMNYCEVSLTFDNQDRALNSSYAEVSVTRRVYRNGEGEYFLNKASCRLRDIVELFRDTGIGRDGYSLIGQGRIDDILSNNGDDRRMVFEEAAGIVTYRARKDEAERKLTRTRENLTRLNDILSEVTARLAPLAEQSEKAQRYIVLAGELKDLEINIFLVRFDNLKTRSQTLQRQTEELSRVLAQQEEEVQTSLRQRDSLEAELSLADEDVSAARAVQDALRECLHEAQNDITRTQARADAMDQDLARSQEAHQDTQQRLGDMKHALEAGTQDTHKMDAQVAEAREVSQQADAALAEALLLAEEAETALNAHREKILDAVNRMSDVKSRQARQQAMLVQMEQQQEQLLVSAAQIREEQERLADTLTEAEQVLAHTISGLDEMIAAEQALAQQTTQARQRMEQGQAKLADASTQLRVMENQLAMLDNMTREYEGYNQAVKRALAFAGDAPDVYGVVARLISVPERYETAIDMALGGTLQHIITEDEDAAKRMIDYLRTNRLGRTTFLPISAVRGRTLSREEERLLSLRGCLGVACELISYDSRFEGVMRSILGRILIADNLDNAIQISRAGRQNISVVTLEGDLLRAGGAMTGGTAQSRTVSLLGRERELVERRQAIAEARDELGKLKDAQHALEQEMEQNARAWAEQQAQVQDERIAVARDTERRNKAREALEACTARLEQAEDALEQLRQAVLDVSQDLQQVSDESRGATMDRESMDALTEQLQQALAEARRHADDLRAVATQRAADLAQQEHRWDLLVRDRERLTREINALEQMAARSSVQSDSARQQREQLMQDIADKQAQLDALTQQTDAATRRVNDLEAKRREKAAAQRDCALALDQLHVAREQNRDKLHRNELLLARLDGEATALSERLFASYELTYDGANELRAEGRFEVGAAEKQAAQLKDTIRELGSINLDAVTEYDEVLARHQEMTIQRDDTIKAENDLMQLIDQLLQDMARQFTAEFDKLNTYFSETFERLFGGGHAELRLADPSRPLDCDIEIAAQPPGKKLQLLSLLSGGERALTAIAILFAMLKLKPTPFCVLDEIEAALDDANIGCFADYLREYSKTTQFIVITHRKGTMEQCDALYGVSMEEKGISSMISVNLQDYAV